MKHTGVILSLAAVLTALCLASCITIDHTLGSGLVPGNQDISLQTATFDLPVGMKMADSLQTSITQNVTVGAIRTGTFGLFHSDAAFSVSAATDSIVWGKNPSVRNLTLNLVTDTTLVTDASQLHILQNLYLHQLNRELDSTMVYNNSLTAADYNPAVISEGGFVFAGGGSYSVKLKKEIGEQLFRIPMATLDSTELFMKDFYGFYLRCDDPVEGTEGGRLNLFDLSSSTLSLTYDYDDDQGNRKTNTAIFQLGMEYTVNVCTSGSRPLEDADPGDGIYMEGLSGIKPYIDAVRLKDAISAWAASAQIPLDKLLIAKATVSFPFEYNGDRTQFDYYAQNLFPCKRKAIGSRIRYTPIDEINNTDLEDGTMDRSQLEYCANVSLYLQDLIKRDRSAVTAADNLWLMPTISYYNSTTGTTYYYADYFYYAQTFLNGTSDTRHPVVKLTYSILK